MFFFNDDTTEYYETLRVLMERWEYEIVEFKEAKGQYSTEKLGQYFSAISNEANLREKQFGWFILGVSEKETSILLVPLISRVPPRYSKS